MMAIASVLLIMNLLDQYRPWARQQRNKDYEHGDKYSFNRQYHNENINIAFLFPFGDAIVVVVMVTAYDTAKT